MNKHVDAALLERLKLHQEWLASLDRRVVSSGWKMPI